MGDRWTDDMVDELFLCSPISAGHFHYVDFVRAIKHGTRRDIDDDSVKAAAASAPVQAPATTPTPASASGGGGGSGKAPSTPSVAPNVDGVVHI